MDTASGAISALRRIGIVIAVAIVFVLGLATTVYLSLRSPEVKVPDVLGKDRFEAEHVLGGAGLKFRIRATRPSNQLKADTVLFQVPRAGDVVKVGQTVAMDISRTAKEGETSEAVAPEKKSDEKPGNENTNEAASGNETKPKRNRTTNKNANENANGNTGNRNRNSSRPTTSTSTNSGNSNRATNLNTNRPAMNGNTNSNRSLNQNGTVRPPLARPSPISKPTP